MYTGRETVVPNRKRVIREEGRLHTANQVH